MGLKKGMTNNPAGRPPGSKNRVSAELREKIGGFLDSNFETITRGFSKMSAKNKLALYKELLPYGLPRLSAVDLHATIDQLSDSQVDEIFSKLLAAINQPKNK